MYIFTSSANYVKLKAAHVGRPLVYLIMPTTGMDCSQIRTLSPQASSGVYVIQPTGVRNPFKVPFRSED